MVERLKLGLSAGERAELEAHRDHDLRPYVRERCAALLKVAGGDSAHAVALSGLLRPRDPDTLYYWVDLYRREGLAGLIARQHGGYHRGCL